MRGAIIAAATLDRDDRLFPADWRVFATNPLGLAFGGTGIALFLDETGGVPAALLDRLDALAAAPSLDRYSAGLYVGLSGIAWAFARLGRVERAAALMRLAYEVPSRFESADLFYGCAGWGLGSLHLHRATGEALFLDGAVAAARHLGSTDCVLPQTEAGNRYHGLAHGAAGIATFLLRLWQVTGDPEHRARAVELLDTELAGASRVGAGVAWPSTVTGKLLAPWWRYGNAGMIPVLLRFHRALGDARYLELARAAAAPLLGYFATVPGLFSGMAGVGIALLELGDATGEASWREEARRLAARLRLFAIEEPGGVGYPSEDLQRVCHDLGTGTAGVGMFLAHLRRGTVPPSPLDLI